MEERKEEILTQVRSHTRVFSISQESPRGKPWGYRPHATLPLENPFVWEPPLQHKYSVLRRN